MKPLSNSIDLCRELCRIPSYGINGGESVIIQFLSEYLENMGVDDQKLIEGIPNRPNLICQIDSGKTGPNLLIAGHVDTFFSPIEQWNSSPLDPIIRDGKLIAAGASDCKGGLAAALCAVNTTIQTGSLNTGKLTLAFTADEDHLGRWGIPWLVESGNITADAAICLSPAGIYADYDGLPLATRGCANTEILVSTQTSGYTWSYNIDKPHAVAVTAHLINALEKSFEPSPKSHPLFPGGATVVAGCTMKGGDVDGQLPESARFSLECRLLPGAKRKDFLDELAAFLENYAMGASIDVHYKDVWFDGFAPGNSISANHFLAVAAHDALTRSRLYGSRIFRVSIVL